MVDNVGSLVADVLGKVLLRYSQYYDTINTVNRDRHGQEEEEDVDQFSVVGQLAQQHNQYSVISRQDEEEDGVSVVSLITAALAGSVIGQLLIFLFGKTRISFLMTNSLYNEYEYEYDMKLHICCLGDLLTPRYKLENDPKCGITTGGLDECYWDCETTTNPKKFGADHSFYFNKVLIDYACLQDCYGAVSMRHR